MDEEGNQRAPHSQAQPLLHVTPGPPPHMPTSPVQHSPTMGGRQEMPLSPNSPPPTMGSSPRKSPPPNITVHDITGQPADSIAVVSASSCHMVEEKPCHVKRRNGDPDGIAMGELRKLRPPPPPEWGRLPHTSDSGSRLLSYGCKLQIFVSFTVFRTASHYICAFRYRLGLCLNHIAMQN